MSSDDSGKFYLKKCPLRKTTGEIHHQSGIEMHQKLPIDCPKKTETIFLKRLKRNIE